MLGDYFRPWGESEWLIPKLPNLKWDFIGCLSTEDRFSASISYLERLKLIDKSLFLKVIDPPSKDTEAIAKMLSTNEMKLRETIKSGTTIEDHPLLEPYSNIVASLDSFLSGSDGNIAIDISTFPKRFFFPLVKRLLNADLKNLIVTYTSPVEYCKDELSGNPHPWDHLPLFMPVDYPEQQIDVAIVSIGFMPFGLPGLLLSRYNSTPVKFLFPFPPGPPSYQRTWDFVRKIEQSFNFKSTDKIIRLDANNMPEAYEYIISETHNVTKRAIFAPYGPKPMSLAMCIYATINDSSVYYTQPTHYNPHYSIGIGTTFAYALILGGKNLYK